MAENPEINKIYLSGTPAEIRSNITNAYSSYLLQKIQEIAEGAISRPLPSYVRGDIYIKVHFDGIIANTRTRHRAEKSFRLVNDNPRTISLERIKAIGNLTQSKFNTFTFKTGVHAYTYNSPEHGFHRVWGYFETIAEAKKVFEQLLDITGVSPDWKRLSHSFVPEPGDRFSATPEKVSQANILVRTDRERPTANMKFKRAAIKFPHIRKELDLVASSGKVFDSLAVLQPYQN